MTYCLERGSTVRPVIFWSRPALCRGLVLACFLFAAATSARAQIDLTGIWIADDGSRYYMRQIGNTLWWAGFSDDAVAWALDYHRGLQFTNVFQGNVVGSSIVGDWADVPRGSNLNSGTLTLNVVTGSVLQRQSATGGFGPSVWQRTGPELLPPDIFTTFDRVKKNQREWRDHSLLDNLKPAKQKPVAIFGTIVPIPLPPYQTWVYEPDPLTGVWGLQYVWVSGGFDPDPMHVNYRTRDGRSYDDFICLDNNDSPPDGDIDFNIQVDRPDLDRQILFWSDGWETSHGITASDFKKKLDVDNELHLESIMYGGTTECNDEGTTSFLLPGWQQSGATGLLLNGRPVAGQMDMADRDSSSSRVYSVLGAPIEFGARVRVTGILALDCGHGIERDCYEDEADFQNQEIHPVNAIDLVQDFKQRRPFASLSGVWGGDDAGTYYVRQIGDTVWWLGVSPDEGRTFANVFQGTLTKQGISGNWADIPLGQFSNAGTIAIGLSGRGQLSTAWTRTNETGGFSGDSWEKLYDAGATKVVVEFQSATSNVPFWPGSPEPFELTVGGKRVEAKPGNPHPVKLPDGRRVTQVDLGARIPLDFPTVGPLRVGVTFAGYRGQWIVQKRDIASGARAQDLMPPRMLPAPASAPDRPDKKEAKRPAGEPEGPFDRDNPANAPPRLTIQYRIERVDPSGPDRSSPAPTR